MEIALFGLSIGLVLALTIFYLQRSKVEKEFYTYLQNKQIDEALDFLQSSKYGFYYGEYSQIWNQLNIYLQLKNTKMIKEKTNEILDIRLNKKQRHHVASKTYYYFLEIEDQEMAEKMLNELSLCTKAEEQQYNELLYRVLIEKKSQDIDTVKDALKENTENEQRGMLQYLLGVQYMYKNDNKNATKYLNKAKQNLKGTAYHSKAKKLLEKKK